MKISFGGGLAAGLIFMTGFGPRLSAQILEFQMRQGQPFPWDSTAHPEDQIIHVTAPGDWSAKITGEMLTNCNGSCFTVKPRVGGEEGEAVISWAGHGAEPLAKGVHTSTLEIGKQHWTVRLRVLPRVPYLPFYYRSGYPKGCHNSDKHMPQDDTCVISNEQPA